jgi:hypothetical protein
MSGTAVREGVRKSRGGILTIKARPIDPRDNLWEIDRPLYRVYFWRRQGPDEDSMWVSDEWELTDVDDVVAAMGWAESNCNGRQFVIYVSALTDDGRGLIRLLGLDPSAHS